jgi:hypothetical protein
MTIHEPMCGLPQPTPTTPTNPNQPQPTPTNPNQPRGPWEWAAIKAYEAVDVSLTKTLTYIQLSSDTCLDDDNRQKRKAALFQRYSSISGRGLHSSTFQLNLSASHGIGGARSGCVARVKGVSGVCRLFHCVRHG